MIPIGDSEKTNIFPFITYLLLALNIGVFILMFGLSSNELENFITTYALIPNEIVKGKDLFTLITSMFLHGGLGHIFSNMIFLHVFGDNLEERFGHIGYLLFYLLCGIGATILQVAVDPNSEIPNLGASGAISGLLGGYLLFFPRHQVQVLVPVGFYTRTATVPASMMLLYWIAFQFIGGLGTIGVEGGGVAYFAHIGGFITGIIVSFIVKILTPSRTFVE